MSDDIHSKLNLIKQRQKLPNFREAGLPQSISKNGPSILIRDAAGRI